MTEITKVATKEGLELAEAERPETVYIPTVDICEDANTFRILADVPGADQRSVNVTVGNGVLTVEAKGSIDPPAGYELVGQEYAVGRFRRDFTLSDQVDVEGIKARVSNGVLTITIPKREDVKARKIEISG